MPGMAHSGAARAAVEALTRELAQRWESAGVAVTAVAAGTFETDVLAKYPANVRAARRALCRCSDWDRRLSTRGWWRCSHRRWDARSTARRSRWTVLATNWFGPWPPPGLAEMRDRAGGGATAGTAAAE